MNKTIVIEIYEEDGKQKIYISEENSTGCEYNIIDYNGIGECVDEYLKEITYS